ncbi:MAG: 2-hydroxyacyl-CoA dehydratase subunit D [Candidatus Helarchaeota archaeon]
MIQKLDLEVAFTRLQELKETMGKKIVGIFPHSLIPDELIYAAGALPLKLTLGGDEYATTKGTEYMTQATCPFARGCIGYFDQKEPIYSLIDGLIGGNFCNGDLIASEYITKFFNVPFIKVTFPTTTQPHALKFLKQEYLKLKSGLEQLTGIKISNEILINTFSKYNNLRDRLQKLNQQMKASSSAILGQDLQKLMHHLFLLGPDDTLQLLDNLETPPETTPKKKQSLLLSGSGIAFGDTLIETIEEFDATVMINDTWSGIHFYLHKLDQNVSEDLFESMTRYYLLKNESSRMVPNVNRVPRVKKLIEEYNINGVIDHVLKFCDPYVADYRRFKSALLDANIPVLQLERDYSTSVEQLKTRLGAFIEMIS